MNPRSGINGASRYNRYPDEKGTERLCIAIKNSPKTRAICYNRYPDEKGTESRRSDRARLWACQVTTVTPMKRGLKASSIIASISKRCYNRYPDEKGTESFGSANIVIALLWSYNRYPDEKGTERYRIPRDPLKPKQRLSAVTTVTPMKRGLKVKFTYSVLVGSAVTTVTPMKRGLKAEPAAELQARPTEVTTVTPMKRGLKDPKTNGSALANTVTTVTPMKRGLKGSSKISSGVPVVLQPLPR